MPLESVPSYTIYKRVEQFMNLGWLASIYNNSRSGWMYQKRYLMVWSRTKCESNREACRSTVGWGGATSHLSVDIVEEARSWKIILFKLPPNSTHFKQALSVGFFGPCKVSEEKCKAWLPQTQFKPVTISVFPSLLCKLFEEFGQWF